MRNGAVRVVVIDAVDLCKTSGNKSSFVLKQTAVRAVFLGENPFGVNNVLTGRSRNFHKSSVFVVRFKFCGDGGHIAILF